MRVVMVPGSGCGGEDIGKCLWYGWLRGRLEEALGSEELKALQRAAGERVEVVLRSFPDPSESRMEAWLPFLRDELGCGEDCVLVGHSTGAQAALRFAEQHRVMGLVVVSACHTDCGNACDEASGYYRDPWHWDAIRAHSREFLAQFGSSDDFRVPYEEQRHVARCCQAEAHFFADRGHFQSSTFPELLDLLLSKLVRHLILSAVFRSSSSSSSMSSSPSIHHDANYASFVVARCGTPLQFGDCLFGDSRQWSPVDVSVSYSQQLVQVNVCVNPRGCGRCGESAGAQERYAGVPLGHRKCCPLHVRTVTGETGNGLAGAGIGREVRVGVCAVIEDAASGRVLVTRRARGMRSFPGAWVFAGGHVDGGETLREGVMREVVEETGLRVDEASLRMMAVWESSFPPDLALGPVSHHHIVFVFACRLVHDPLSLVSAGLLSTLMRPHPLERLAANYRLQQQEVDCVAWLSPAEFRGCKDTVIDQLAIVENSSSSSSSSSFVLTKRREPLSDVIGAMTRSVLFVFTLLSSTPSSI